jgi:hypothetical protein
MSNFPDVSQCAHTTLAVVAGGEGRRMGRPKGHLTLDGRPIPERLMNRLAWAGPTLLVTAPGREHPPGCRLFTKEATDPVLSAAFSPHWKMRRRTRSSFYQWTCQTLRPRRWRGWLHACATIPPQPL